MNLETRVSAELLRHLESLSKLELEEGERTGLKRDIEEILQYMTLLDDLDLSVDEMVSPVEIDLEPRSDVVQSFEQKEKITENFPEKSGPYITIPRIYKDE
jgi:aspartyl-tRNA(Asn)/glutamyl-tRNA(Gln) amidotransferase subunit C